MRKIILAALMLIATSAMADRFSGLSWYSSRWEAANATSSGATQPLMATGSSTVPFVQLSLFYCQSSCCTGADGSVHCAMCSVILPPLPPIAISWHEFKSTDDSWCRPSVGRPAFRSLSDCASWWYDQFRPAYRRIGRATTTERTEFMYWFND